MNRAPVLFISHGSPDLAVSDNAITESWRSLQQHFNQVNAVVVLSAHWLTDAIHIGANPDPDLVYDFSGFPEALYKLKYPAKMDKAVSLKVQAAVQQHFKHNVNLDSERGFDHGVWVPMLHLLPEIKCPIIPISIGKSLNLNEIYHLGQSLQPLREEGIAIIGSGGLTHNLLAMKTGEKGAGYVRDFEFWVRDKVINGKYQEIIDAPKSYPGFSMLHPTIEHFVPLLFALGASKDNDDLCVIKNEIVFNVLSMESYFWS